MLLSVASRSRFFLPLVAPSQRHFHASAVSERFIHRKYLRGIPHPRPATRAKLDAAIAETRAHPRFWSSPEVSFDELFTVCRDGLVHKGDVPSMRRIASLLNKVQQPDELQRCIVLLKHLQRQLWEFTETVSNSFVDAGLRVDKEDVVVLYLHRSVLDRKRPDEEPFYRIFPSAVAYERLIARFVKKGDLGTALRVFSMAAAQFRDNPPAGSGRWTNVYLAGMRIYFEKKRYDQAVLVHREARYLGLHEHPFMLLMRMRIEVLTAEQPRLDWLRHMAARLSSCGIHSTTPGSIVSSEAAALIAYASNDRQAADAVPAHHRAAVARFLYGVLDAQRVEQLWPAQAEAEVEAEVDIEQVRAAKLQLAIENLKKNPFYAHYSPHLMTLILTRTPKRNKDRSASQAFPRPVHEKQQLRQVVNQLSS